MSRSAGKRNSLESEFPNGTVPSASRVSGFKPPIATSCKRGMSDSVVGDMAVQASSSGPRTKGWSWLYDREREREREREIKTKRKKKKQ